VSIFNPWGALCKARQSLKEQNDRINELYQDLIKEQQRRNTDRSEYELRGRLLKSEIDRLNDLLKEGHFRNPKTGRLGVKGERF
jgi:hypothetical protein